MRRSSTATRSRSATTACACSASTRPKAVRTAGATARRGAAARTPPRSCAASCKAPRCAACRATPTSTAAALPSARTATRTSTPRWCARDSRSRIAATATTTSTKRTKRGMRSAGSGPASSRRRGTIAANHAKRRAQPQQQPAPALSPERRHPRHDAAELALRDQGQHQPTRRPDLSPAGVGFVRQHRHRRTQRRTLVLLRSRSARRRLACRGHTRRPLTVESQKRAPDPGRRCRP